MKEIVLNVESKEIRCAWLAAGLLQELTIERWGNRQLVGNIYRGEVVHILGNIQSAFVDIDEGVSGFIHISDILENSQKFQEMFDMDFSHDGAIASKKSLEPQEADIAKLLKPGQPVLVQVVKEPIGTKGARLTSNVSIAGRYLVLLPNTPHRGVSRKIEDEQMREECKRLLQTLDIPPTMGVICRTAGVYAKEDALVSELKSLLKAWQEIVHNFNKASKPTCLYRDSDLIKKAVLTAVDKRFAKMTVDDFVTYKRCKKLLSTYGEEHPIQLELYKDWVPIFERFHIEKEIERALRPKVWLPSGGYLFFEKTEAMYTIDVNSGRSTRQTDTGNAEEALMLVNLEAAREIARQLVLRNLGGIIVCDFIDLQSAKNRRRVVQCLKEAMKEDSARCTILPMNELCLVEITRQRTRDSLERTICVECPYCQGSGLIKSHESISIDIERSLRKIIGSKQAEQVIIELHPSLENFLGTADKGNLSRLVETKWSAKISFLANANLHLNEVYFYAKQNGKRIEI